MTPSESLVPHEGTWLMQVLGFRTRTCLEPFFRPPQLAFRVPPARPADGLASFVFCSLPTALSPPRPAEAPGGKGPSWLQLGLSFLSALMLGPGTAAPMGVLQTAPQIPPSQEALPHPPPHTPVASSSHLLCTSPPSKTVYRAYFSSPSSTMGKSGRQSFALPSALLAAGYPQHLGQCLRHHDAHWRVVRGKWADECWML